MSEQTRSRAVIAAGIIEPTTLEEVGRWGMDLPKDVPPIEDKEEAIEGIREALEAHDIVEIRQTELDAIRTFQNGATNGRLYYAYKGKTTFIDIHFARDEAGSYIIPWRSERIFDLMLDRDTYLKPSGADRVYFADVTDLYYGTQKMFMLCVPVRKERLP